MKRSQSITGVIHNFLGAYTSRYSDFKGYWAFGMIVDDLFVTEIDLLDTRSENVQKNVGEYVLSRAQNTFKDQMSKAGILHNTIERAILQIRRCNTKTGFINNTKKNGWIVDFTAEVVTKKNLQYRDSKMLFIAPHDSRNEFRSARYKIDEE